MALPKYRIVKGPWNKETKKWDAEYGAVWEKEWPDGGVSLTVQFKESPPTGEFLKMIEVKRKTVEPPFQQALDIAQNGNNDPLDVDDVPF